MEHFKSLSTEEKEDNRVVMERSIEQTTRIQKLFKGKDGELALKAIDGLTGYGSNKFHSDPYIHAYNAGMVAVSVTLRHLIERDVKEARKVMNERAENE
jgi:hypothetical protein